MDFSAYSFFVTGGTGSFGHRVVAALLEADAAKVTVFSRDERKQHDMRLRFRDPRLRFVVGDVRDPVRVAQAIGGHDFVFSAAALKQVPTCEFHPIEAVKTNVLGTENVCRAAIDAGCLGVVLLSTDKACYPVNTMGLTKALSERLAWALTEEKRDTRFTVVRYGNVVGSRGSVLETWVKALRAGKPATVTDPDMTRFLMHLDDAVALVFDSFMESVPGGILVKKAPATTMLEFAEATREVVGGGGTIEVVGPRPGEKKHEVLMTQEESVRARDLGDRFLIYPHDPKKYGVKPIDEPFVFSSLSAHRMTECELKQLINKCLPHLDGN